METPWNIFSPAWHDNFLEFFTWNHTEYPWKISHAFYHGIPWGITSEPLFCRIAENITILRITKYARLPLYAHFDRPTLLLPNLLNLQILKYVSLFTKWKYVLWNVVSVSQQVHYDRTVPIIYNKGYIAYFSLRMREKAIFSLPF